MGLLGKLFSKKPDPAISEQDFYSVENQEAVRKWGNRFTQWSDTEADFWQYVADFRAKNGFPPKVNDAIWAILNKQRTEAAQHQQFGRYAILTDGMCGLLASEGKYDDALRHAIERITLDASGVSTAGQGTDNRLIIDPSLAFVSNHAIAGMTYPGIQLGLTVEALRQKFMGESEACLNRLGSLRPQVEPQEIWIQIEQSVVAAIAEFSSKPKTSRKRITEPVLMVVER